MNDNRQQLIEYYLERAKSTQKDAELLASCESWESCVNRLYYACFYAVTALLEQHNYTAGKHTGVRSLFNQHFVHTGVVPAEFGDLYNLLFIRRHHSDYVEFYDPDITEIQPWVAETEAFINFIAQLLLEAPPDAINQGEDE
jgi:uncharacterized protein (UPF0332 family)